MQRARGVLFATSPEGVREAATFTCYHCNAIRVVPHGQRGEDIGGLCKQCMGVICPACVARMTCTPWEKQMEAMEARDRARRSYMECA